MGILDKLKAATNAITGGAATVNLEMSQGSLTQGVTIRVTAVAKADVKITSVYAEVLGSEKAKVRGIREHSHFDGRGKHGDVTGTIATAQSRYMISGAEALVEGQSYSWEQHVQLPPGMASFQGQTIGYEWTARAGIDTPGTDPDSGWTLFVVVP